MFNRPTVLKIAGLDTPFLRNTMSLMVRTHIAPRAYLWGLADTLRAGVEGRPYPIYFINREYIRRLPWYYFPCQILSKLPVGLFLLSVAGTALLMFRRLPVAFRQPLWVVTGFAGLFLLTIVLANSGYAGVRHALPVYPASALLGGAAVLEALHSRSRVAIASVSLAVTAAIVFRSPGHASLGISE